MSVLQGPMRGPMSGFMVGGARPTSGGGGGTLITETFSDLSGWTGATSVASVANGDLRFTGEGFIRHTTSLASSGKWVRVQPGNFLTSSSPLFVGLSDSSGNARGWSFVLVGSTTLRVDYSTSYSTYTTWVSDAEIQINVSTFSAGQYVGITFDPGTSTIRLWGNVSGAIPESLTSWDSRAADVTNSANAFPSNALYLCAGCWTGSGTGTHYIDNVTAGSL